MDINDFRGFHTVVLMAIFLGIVWWAYSRKRKKSFDEAANLPFADEDKHQATVKKEEQS
jgi:cytochrome c oxidase cbb3-type subunit IV